MTHADVTTRFIANVFHNPDRPLFSKYDGLEQASDLLGIGLIEFLASVTPFEPSPRVAASRAAASALSFFEYLNAQGFLSYVCICDGPWQTKSKFALRRREKQWDRISLLSVPGVTHVGRPKFFHSDQGFRMAVAAAVEGEALLASLELVRADGACFIVLSRERISESEELISWLFASAFPESKKFDPAVVWPSLVSAVCRDGNFVVRVTGWFDDRETTVGVFGAGGLLQQPLSELR